MSDYYKRAYAEIHIDRARRNVEKIKTLLSEGSEIMAVVKANAYGHDDSIIAPLLEGMGIKYFAVSNIHEAIKLRNSGIKGEILILGYTSEEYCHELYYNNIITAVVSEEHAKKLSGGTVKPVRCHVAVDTGMGRIGIRAETPDKCAEIIKRITELPNIELEGIFTHLSVADSYNDENIRYTKEQIDFFNKAGDEVEKMGVKLQHRHYLNSAGGTFYRSEKSTLSRFGIMLYGLTPDRSLKMPVKLEPVMELKAEVAYVNDLNKGRSVSYGRMYTAEKDIKTAVLTIGYADGYSRLLSGKAYVLIKGKRASIIGKICMDQLMIDVTGIDVKPGDIATLIGTEGNETITADNLAELYGTIGYEIVCGISKRVPRVIVDGGKLIKVIEY